MNVNFFVKIKYHSFFFKIKKSFKWNENALKRSAQGLISVLLSLKKSPVIRYQNSSDMCRKLADSIRVSFNYLFKNWSFIFLLFFNNFKKNIISRDANLFDFRQNDIAPVLLILDRREDTVTPLLNQVR